MSVVYTLQFKFTCNRINERVAQTSMISESVIWMTTSIIKRTNTHSHTSPKCTPLRIAMVCMCIAWFCVWECIGFWQAPAIIWDWGCFFLSSSFSPCIKRARDILPFLWFYGLLFCISHLDRAFHVRHSFCNRFLHGTHTQYECKYRFVLDTKIRLIMIYQLWLLLVIPFVPFLHFMSIVEAGKLLRVCSYANFSHFFAKNYYDKPQQNIFVVIWCTKKRDIMQIRMPECVALEIL